MLDFVISKVAMIVAAIFILIAGIGLWEIQNNAMEEEELQNIADDIAKMINEINAIEANTAINFTFDSDEDGIYLKPTIGDDKYKIRFFKDILFISQNDRKVSSVFVNDIHVWEAEQTKYNDTELYNLDRDNRELSIKSGGNMKIIAERTQIEVMGLMEYHTFIYTKE